MHTTKTSGDSRRRAGYAATGLATAVLAAGFLTALTAPAARAVVTDLQVSPGTPAFSWGPQSQYGTSCTYTLTATVTIGDDRGVSFYDWTEAASFAPANYVSPANGTATVGWTPTRPGWHHISAYQGSEGGPAVDVLVGNGINTGSACLVLP
ncbi:hypothetical protein BJY24_006273 [Nocardia transvalensis]|uniref:Uncharacterized protein n=1 Tax=Nocardia transvalensis TaxID=37333 RepID=A0A7W9PJW1_9NOCA|nr:hypothetical protein [Nocardia transvalensis]MBB5917361.1 hypothetical protein [Nocardia transvalensis]